MNQLHARYQTNLALLTDLYQLTMAYGYWKTGKAEDQAIFNLFFRKNPFQGNYAIACGLEDVIHHLSNFHFDESDINYLANLTTTQGNPLFEKDFLNYLQQLTFSCDVDAVPEGSIVFANQPLLRIKGPLLQAQLIETFLLNSINFQTLIASKAMRIAAAAQGDSILEFGLRRAQGIDGSLSASRAAYIGGCHATSNVLAGKLYDIPVKGTHAHSWIMSFDTEQEAFLAYAQTFPENAVFLVDTYDTLEGVRTAIQVGQQLREQGHQLLGIRLDSGDLVHLSQQARQLLDEAGFHDTTIIASDGLDDHSIAQLKAAGATIHVWGVGTNLVTAKDQPALGGVYKLAAIRKKDEPWTYKIKLSENPIKISTPGMLQVRRYQMSDGKPFGDMIWNQLEKEPIAQIQSFDGRTIVATERSYQDLLLPIFKAGQLVYQLPNIHQIREYSKHQKALFEKVNFNLYPIGLEQKLNVQKLNEIKKLRN